MVSLQGKYETVNITVQQVPMGQQQQQIRPLFFSQILQLLLYISGWYCLQLCCILRYVTPVCPHH